MKSLIGFVAACVASQIEAVKILMAGDFDKDGRAFFESIANSVSSNGQYENTVYFLSTDLAAREVVKVNEKMYKYGVGTERVFKYDCHGVEYDEYTRLDKQTAEMYFSD